MLNYRKTTEADIPTLVRWRNDPDTIAMSLHRGPRTAEEMKHEGPLRLIATCACLSADVGVIGVVGGNGDGGGEYCAWTVAPEYRKQGYGKLLVQELCRIADSSHSDFHTLKAAIRADNEASLKIAQHCGFRYVRSYRNNHDCPANDSEVIQIWWRA